MFTILVRHTRKKTEDVDPKSSLGHAAKKAYKRCLHYRFGVTVLSFALLTLTIHSIHLQLITIKTRACTIAYTQLGASGI